MVMRSLSLAILLVAALVGGFVWFAATLPAEVEAPGRRTDAIVVLTGGADRVAEGLRLLAADRADRLFISGVNPSVTPQELLALVPDVPAEIAGRMVLGYLAGDTEGNAVEAAQWVKAEDVGSIRLVTAAYHMPRSLLEFRRTLPDVEIVAHPVFPEAVKENRWWKDGDVASVLVSEYLKYLVALVSGPFRG